MATLVVVAQIIYTRLHKTIQNTLVHMMLNILMSVWGARIDAINENMRILPRAIEPQGYADDCCATTSSPEALEIAIEKGKLFAMRTGLLLAGEKEKNATFS